ncbi:MAG: DNA-binding protein [Planctomycetes bacterium]|nr:DNA-binding protein [Planctomycetota bacterium]
MELKTLFVAWQDPRSRRWTPIARLTHDGTVYRFQYTSGAERARREYGFVPLQSFPALEEAYESSDLFPLFSNRLPNSNRPDYSDYVQWLGVTVDERDPIILLGRSGGRRMTDALEVFPCPDMDERGEYHVRFFSHGISHLPEDSKTRISKLSPGDRLLLFHDFQNPHDPFALGLRTAGDNGDRHLVGYCPSYLLRDAFELIKDCPFSPVVTVERVNAEPAPLQMRLLCKLTSCWPEGGFVPCSSDDYQPIVVTVPAN